MSYLWFAVAVLMTILGVAALVGVGAALKTLAHRSEVSRLRKQNRVVGLPRAMLLVRDEGHCFVVNRTTLPGVLWVVSGPVDPAWPLQALLQEQGTLVEGVPGPQVEAQLRRDFVGRVLVCDGETFVTPNARPRGEP